MIFIDELAIHKMHVIHDARLYVSTSRRAQLARALWSSSAPLAITQGGSPTHRPWRRIGGPPQRRLAVPARDRIDEPLEILHDRRIEALLGAAGVGGDRQRPRVQAR